MLFRSVSATASSGLAVRYNSSTTGICTVDADSGEVTARAAGNCVIAAICEDIPNEQPEKMITAEVFPDALEQVNKWYDQGHVIHFFTSRTEALREITEQWLDKHGFKYHGIVRSYL